MPSGIKIEEDFIGSGLVAGKNSTIVANVRAFLSKGEKVFDTAEDGRPWVVDLFRREPIAGFRKGVEGMRVGGRRRFVVSPHLAYGAKGVPGKVPPNAVLRFEVELLAVHAKGDKRWATIAPEGKHLSIFKPGEFRRNTPRIQFNLGETGEGSFTITTPTRDGDWRRATSKQFTVKLSHSEREALFQSVEQTLQTVPKECLNNDQLCADASEKANSVTRTQDDHEPCVTIGIWKRGDWTSYFAMRESSRGLLDSAFYTWFTEALRKQS